MLDIDTTVNTTSSSHLNNNTTNDVTTSILDTTTTTTTPIITTTSTVATASTLPPRKRAKTQEEKEQRKIERILRNRRAAHASREKKRRHVEYLEVYVVKLEESLQKLTSGYQQLLEKMPIQDQISIEELGLEDVSELKNQIHSNLNGSRRGGSNRKGGDHTEVDEEDDDEDDHEHEDLHKHEESSPSDVQVKVQPSESQLPSKKRKYCSRKEKASPTTAVTPPSSTRNSSITSSPDVHVKSEVEEEEDREQCQENNNSLQPMNDKTFYNYLSPISIHSSASSPMDFTLNSKSDFNDFIFGEVKTKDSIENTSHETLKDVPSQQQSTTEVSTQESNLSLYELGQNSAVILSIEEEKQQPQRTLVEILEKENNLRLAISV